jgi:hypothetical protein
MKKILFYITRRVFYKFGDGTYFSHTYTGIRSIPQVDINQISPYIDLTLQDIDLILTFIDQFLILIDLNFKQIDIFPTQYRHFHTKRESALQPALSHNPFISLLHSSFCTFCRCRKYMEHFGPHPASSQLAFSSLLRRLPLDLPLPLLPLLGALGYCGFPPS